MSVDLELLKNDIVSSIDITSFYESSLNGQRAQKFDSDGWSNKMLCPIHVDVNTPNFAFNVNTGGFKCFSCGAGGSIFDFWLTINGYSPKDTSSFMFALSALASEAGIDVGEWKKTSGASHAEKRKKIDRVIDSASKLNKAESNDATNAPIADAVVRRMSDAIQPDHVNFLLGKRGLKKKTIEKFRLGYDDSWIYKDDSSQKWCRGRITIPVFNVTGECRNIRGYTHKGSPAYKMANYVVNKGEIDEKSYGSPPRLFNLDKMVSENWEHVVICEGEFDAILLYQELRGIGLDTWGTVTGTHGVKTFEPEWVKYFKGRHVYICFDCDDDGKIAAPSVATQHFLPGIKSGAFKSVRIIKLPLDGSKEYKDISDFFLKAELTINDFIELCSNEPQLIVGGVSEDEASVEPIVVDNLVEAILDKRYIDKKIRVPIAISGVTSRLYHAVREYEIGYCPCKKESSQDSCCHDGVGATKIPYGHPLFIQCCMQPEEKTLKSIAHTVCSKHQKCEVRPISKVVMEEYYAHQVSDRLRAEEVDGHLRNTQELFTIPVYVLQPPGGIVIKPQNYTAIAYVRTHPNTSLTSLFIESLEPLEDEWNKFDSKSRENVEILKNLKEGFDVDSIVEQLTNHVTRIYESDEILYATILSFLSPIQFIFNNEPIRGWLNIAIIGDSGTGKSATYSRLSDWIGIGDLFSALSGTRTGLLYAMRQRGNEWHIAVGAYVRASGKIIAIDETQEMEADEIKKMAIAMETGFLKIERVASGGYQTRTRTIFLLNPKHQNGQAATISEFMYGAECLRNCFAYMFIRRLDLAVFTTGNSKHDFYNKITTPVSELKLTPLMMKTLVFWSWTRKPENIIWKQSSVEVCLNEATRLSGIFGYVDLIPLVCPQDFRLKLARLSVAYSILSCNFTDDFQSVTVEPDHVRTMAALIEVIYSSNSCDLNQLSDLHKSKSTLGDSYLEIKAYFESRVVKDRSSGDPVIRERMPFIQLVLSLMSTEYLNKKDLCDSIGVGSSWISERITGLRAHDLLEQTRYGFRRTKKFNLFIKQWRKESGVSSMLSSVFKMISGSSKHDVNDAFDSASISDSNDLIMSDPFI